MATLKNIIKEYDITNIINYLRKSRQDEERERKTGEDTLHEQKKLMDRVLADYGIPYDQKPEVGSGDKIATRPVFQSVVEDIRQNKYDAIAVKEISRMGRGSYTDMGLIYDLIQDKRLYIITPWKIYDPSNPSDLRQIRFELFMSREEFETTRERLSGGRYNAALEGKWVAGRAPFGYDYDQHTKHLVPNEKEAEVVRSLFDFYANGIVLETGRRKFVQFRALATYLGKIGFITPKGRKEWSATQVKRLLENDRYIGTMRFNTMMTTADGKRVPRPENEHIIVKDAHEAIIDQETWDKVQARIENRDTTNTRLEFDPCELAGICRCVVCGRKMVRQYGTQHYKKVDGTKSVYKKEFLWCTTTGCTFVKYRHIEEDLLQSLQMLGELDNSMLRKQIDILAVKKETKSISAADIQKSIDIRREDIERRMKFIFDKYESGIYTDEMFLQRKAEIDKEKDSLDTVKIQTPSITEPEDINPDQIRKNLNSFLEAYHNATHKSDRNAILRSIFDHVDVEIIEKGRGRRPAKHKIYPTLKLDHITQITV